MRDDAGLEIADVVRCVVYELNVPDAALVRLLEPLELSLEEVESLDIADDRGLAGGVRGFEIGRRKRAAQAMTGDRLIRPIEALEMVLVELARIRLAQRPEHPIRVPAENGTIRHVCEAGDRQRSSAHALCEIAIGRRL